MAEYIFTNLPQYVKINSRSEFSSSVVSSGAILLFTEDGYTLTGKLPDGTFITIGGSSGTDVSDTTATAGTVLGGYDFYDSAGSKTTGTIPTVSAALSGNLVIVPSGYIAASQTFNVSGGIDVSSTTAEAQDVLSGKVFYNSTGTLTSGTLITSGGAEVTLGYVSSGVFYELAFSGTSSIEAGSSAGLSAYAWNLPVSSGSSGGSSGTVISSGQSLILSSGMSASNVTIQDGGIMYVSSGAHASDVTANSGALIEVGGGASASNITIDSGASFYVWSGGTALDCGYATTDNILVFDGAIVTYSSSGSQGSGTYISAVSVLTPGQSSNIDSGTTVGMVSVGSGAEITNAGVIMGGVISSGDIHNTIGGSNGGSAFNLSVVGGEIHAYHSAVISSAILNPGVLGLSLEAVGRKITVFSGGIIVSSGGTALEPVLMGAQANLLVYSGGTALNVTSQTGANIVVSSGGYITYKS